MVSESVKELGEPPAFGHPMLQHFGFESTYINLNNGSYGSLPLPVLAACERLTRQIEANPDRFLRFTGTYAPLLSEVRARVAELIGADTDDCVIVPNATHGVNTVLRNLDWDEGDIIVGSRPSCFFSSMIRQTDAFAIDRLADVTYAAVSRTIQYLADIKPHLRQFHFPLKFPTTRSIILDEFRSHLKNLPRQPGCKVVAIIDSIVSIPGALLPWQELVKICKEEGVMTVIDAAHSIGQEMNINLKEADPDFWISNCHKWLYAKRGCAVLYVPKRNQRLIRSSIPTSWHYVSPTDPPGGPEPPNFINQFQWTGTRDIVPYLSVSAALDFRQWIGGEQEINNYCHKLALSGGRRLAEILGTRVLDANGEFTANMVNVELPLEVGGSQDVLSKIVKHLDSKNVNGKPYYHNDRWWVRCSTQIFNEVSDFEKLGEALSEACKAVLEKQ